MVALQGNRIVTVPLRDVASRIRAVNHDLYLDAKKVMNAKGFIHNSLS
jgi:hypothetical protein